MKINNSPITGFGPSGCLTYEGIELYLSGSAVPDIKIKIEKHIHCCPLCNEALEGYNLATDKYDLQETISGINTKLAGMYRKGATGLAGGIIKHNLRIKVFRYMAAASVILLLGLFTYLIIHKEEEPFQNSRLLGEGVILSDTLNYFSILGDDFELIDEIALAEQDQIIPIETTQKISETATNREQLKPVKTGQKEISASYVVKNDMIIRESKQPELLKPLNYPFEVFVKKKIDSLLIKNPRPVKYDFTAEFIISKEGLLKQPRIVSSSDSKLDSFAVRVLEGSPKWKPATINNTPVDYPVRMKIRKD